MKIKYLVIMFFATLMSCSSGNRCWEYDGNYTNDLIHNYSGYYKESIPNSVASVDVIQVYSLKEKKNHVLPLNILRRQRLISELRKKEDIVTFFDSFQKIDFNTDHHITSKDCPADTEKYAEVFHIVAFDATLMRVAYFRYFPCTVKGNKYGMIIPLDDSGVFYNIKPPISVFHKMRERVGS